MKKMCKHWVESLGLELNRVVCHDDGIKCPKNTDHLCEIVRTKIKMVRGRTKNKGEYK